MSPSSSCVGRCAERFETPLLMLCLQRQPGTLTSDYTVGNPFVPPHFRSHRRSLITSTKLHVYYSLYQLYIHSINNNGRIQEIRYRNDPGAA